MGILRRAARVLPTGTGVVGVWVAISGVLAYVFLAVTGRALGAHEASGLSTLWISGFLVGNAAGMPVEQEVARAIASRRAQALGVGPVIRRAAIASGFFGVAVAVCIAVAGAPLVRNLFGGNWVLLGALIVLFLGTMAEYLVRGVLAGLGRFAAYGRLLGAEAAVRVVAVIGLAAAGVSQASPYGVVLALAPFVGIAAAVGLGDRALIRSGGPVVPWRELTRSLGWLLGAAVFAQALVNLGPLFVRLLAHRDAALTSAFVASLIVARVPVFLFQAAQAALIPRLSHHAGGGRAERLAAETKALARALLVFVIVATIGAALLGPVVVRIGWGDDFALGARDFALLAAASGAYLLAVTFASALVALERPHHATAGWFVGFITFMTCVVVGRDVLTRVEVGFLIGAVAAATVLGGLARHGFRQSIARESIPENERGGR